MFLLSEEGARGGDCHLLAALRFCYAEKGLSEHCHYFYLLNAFPLSMTMSDVLVSM